MRFRRSVRTWLRLDWERRWLLLAAVAAVPLASLALRGLPFSRIAVWLGRPETETAPGLTSGQDRRAHRISWAVRAAARRVPGNNRCLVQALAAAALARLSRVPTTLYLGVARNGQGRLEAHAWLRCGSRILTGRSGYRRFAVVGRFGRG
jgi:Transglutaminase-like superfamily